MNFKKTKTMKTHSIKTPTAELMILELPIGWDYEPITDDKTFIYHKTEDGTNDHHIEGYTLLGKPDEIREEDVMALVESFGRGKLKRFKWYNKNQFEKTAKESILSLLEPEIYWDNPWGVNGAHLDSYKHLWKEAEEKTFDRKRSLIFKKN